MKPLARYRNGNYRVTLFEDGTKVKHTEEDSFVAAFPDSIDLKITDYCENHCPMCHECSSPAGRHGDLSHPLIDTFPMGIEAAIGGGNPLAHPDLIPFLERLKKKGVVANLTVNVIDLKKQTALIEKLIDDRLIYGLGVSCQSFDEFALRFALSHPNVVLHLINGIFPIEDYRKLMGHLVKVLILGYKTVGKGKSYLSPAVRERMRETEAHISEFLKGFKVISFDNLAIEQLHILEKIGEKAFNEIYMGDDGDASMYVDLVKEECAVSSSSEVRFPLAETLEASFRLLPRK